MSKVCYIQHEQFLDKVQMSYNIEKKTDEMQNDLMMLVGKGVRKLQRMMENYE